MRAFIFSLDAFVAFTLALVAIYSLIFFSSVPSSYYYLLTQGHYLARDAAMTLSTTQCYPHYRSCPVITGSLLDNLASDKSSAVYREDLIIGTIGEMIPNQFGYRVELSVDEGENWDSIYDTSEVHDEVHTGKGKKLSVSSQVISFGYVDHVSKEEESIHRYRTCNPGDDSADVITCGPLLNVDPSSAVDIIPELQPRLIRITVFI